MAGGRPPVPRVQLTAGALVIRPWRLDDAAALAAAARESSAEILPWMGWARPDYSVEDAVTFLAGTALAWTEERAHEFAVTGADGGLLGGVGVNQINRLHRFANLGYWVRTSAARRGVTSAAARAVARWALATLDIHRLEIVVGVGNVASEGVAARIGAHREGVLRGRLHSGERAMDATMFSLLAADVAR